jgi:hypothetical protein
MSGAAANDDDNRTEVPAMSNSTEEWNERAEEDGTYAIAAALVRVASALRDLGNGNAATPMGAIEAYGKRIGEKLDHLNSVIAEVGERLAEAIETSRTDHPLQGETLGGLEAALNAIAEAIAEAKTAPAPKDRDREQPT